MLNIWFVLNDQLQPFPKAQDWEDFYMSLQAIAD